MPEAVSFVTQKRKKTFVREFELAMGGGGGRGAGCKTVFVIVVIG